MCHHCTGSWFHDFLMLPFVKELNEKIRECISHSSDEKYGSKLFDVSCDIDYNYSYMYFVN